MADDITATVVAGLLGGGVAGAVVGGLLTLVGQNRQFDREDRNRFADVRRERFTQFLGLVDDHVRSLVHQRGYFHGAYSAKGGVPTEVPTIAGMTEITTSAIEVGLLATENIVGDLAMEVCLRLNAARELAIDIARTDLAHWVESTGGRFRRARPSGR